MNLQKLKYPELFQAKCFSDSIVFYHYLHEYDLRLTTEKYIQGLFKRIWSSPKIKVKSSVY